jgi:hypothetical protein
MLKIHGVPFSAHTRKVILAALEKGIPHEIVPVIPLTPPPGWTDLSPLGLIPPSRTATSRWPILGDLPYLDRAYPGPRSIRATRVNTPACCGTRNSSMRIGAARAARTADCNGCFAPKFLGKAPTRR